MMHKAFEQLHSTRLRPSRTPLNGMADTLFTISTEAYHPVFLTTLCSDVKQKAAQYKDHHLFEVTHYKQKDKVGKYITNCNHLETLTHRCIDMDKPMSSSYFTSTMGNVESFYEPSDVQVLGRLGTPGSRRSNQSQRTASVGCSIPITSSTTRSTPRSAT